MQIEYSISHEVNYTVPNEFGVQKPERLWIKMGVTDEQRIDEGAVDAAKRVSDFVHTEALKAAHRAVQSVRDR